MKRLGLLLAFGLIFTFKLEAKKIDGKIIYEHDTIEVTFKIPIKFFSQEQNYEKLQNKVKYYDSNGTKAVLRPGIAKEIQFEHNSEKVRMLSRYNSLGLGNMFTMSSNIFLKLEIDGKMKLFKYYYSQSSPGVYNASTGMMTAGYSYNVERFILKKGNGELKRPKGLTFKKDMIHYFSDCPALAEKIKNKYFRKGDLDLIVLFYNSNRCQQIKAENQ